MAPSRKKHAREVKRDKVREKTLEQFDRIGDRLEGKGRTILYALAGLVGLAVLALIYQGWSGRKADRVRQCGGMLQLGLPAEGDWLSEAHKRPPAPIGDSHGSGDSRSPCIRPIRHRTVAACS